MGAHSSPDEDKTPSRFLHFPSLATKGYQTVGLWASKLMKARDDIQFTDKPEYGLKEISTNDERQFVKVGLAKMLRSGTPATIIHVTDSQMGRIGRQGMSTAPGGQCLVKYRFPDGRTSELWAHEPLNLMFENGQEASVGDRIHLDDRRLTQPGTTSHGNSSGRGAASVSLKVTEAMTGQWPHGDKISYARFYKVVPADDARASSTQVPSRRTVRPRKKYVSDSEEE